MSQRSFGIALLIGLGLAVGCGDGGGGSGGFIDLTGNPPSAFGGPPNEANTPPPNPNAPACTGTTTAGELIGIAANAFCAKVAQGGGSIGSGGSGQGGSGAQGGSSGDGGTGAVGSGGTDGGSCSTANQCATCPDCLSACQCGGLDATTCATACSGQAQIKPAPKNSAAAFLSRISAVRPKGARQVRADGIDFGDISGEVCSLLRQCAASPSSCDIEVDSIPFCASTIAQCVNAIFALIPCSGEIDLENVPLPPACAGLGGESSNGTGGSGGSGGSGASGGSGGTDPGTGGTNPGTGGTTGGDCTQATGCAGCADTCAQCLCATNGDTTSCSSFCG